MLGPIIRNKSKSDASKTLEYWQGNKAHVVKG